MIIIEVHFYTLYCCFSMDYLPFHFNENPKQTLTSKTIYHSPTLWGFCHLSWWHGHIQQLETQLRNYIKQWTLCSILDS